MTENHAGLASGTVSGICEQGVMIFAAAVTVL